ncbi:GNAT family N-acetyltransferase [Chitinimonas sp. BJB300]|nr:GNAT family N-acetyltransferase [Chitinimonas sp. BJB300]PHV10372.1 GNAT family N-acetyltransferase [Chitinimonas sp. BJB300]TSJ91033.1 GNAT family N-acetyltransferase [Chitinimonas sp. BJB300]
MLRIEVTSPMQPEARRLIDALDDYQQSLYPAESNHLLSIEALAHPDVDFHLAWLGEQAVGCAAIVAKADYAEIKRMYVDPACRGKGIAKALMAGIASAAQQRGITALKLETGIHQPEAIALYRRQGFAECTPFGDYQPDPLSLFMHKAL